MVHHNKASCLPRTSQSVKVPVRLGTSGRFEFLLIPAGLAFSHKPGRYQRIEDGQYDTVWYPCAPGFAQCIVVNDKTWRPFRNWSGVEACMLITRPSLLLAIVLIGGCIATGAPVTKIESLSADARDAVIKLPVYTESELTGKEHAIIDSVEGTSCQFRRDDPAATETDAINEAKYWAKDRGADGVKNVTCEAPRGKSFFNRCWKRITCTGQAIKFAR